MGGIPQGAAPDWSHCERLAMTDALNEQLSALLDGELPDGESELVLKRLERTPLLRDTLGRYALIGEAMRSTEPVVAAPPGFASRISAALAQEAPVAQVVAAPATRTRVRVRRETGGGEVGQPAAGEFTLRDFLAAFLYARVCTGAARDEAGDPSPKFQE